MTDMIKVQTTDLAGAALDWAVAKVEEVPVLIASPQYGTNWRVYKPGFGGKYSPSTDWAVGGLLLDKHCTSFGVIQDVTASRWRSFAYKAETGMSRLAGGESILIAACRAIVTLNLGDTVQVPKELLS
jgi:hypothetical protein